MEQNLQIVNNTPFHFQDITSLKKIFALKKRIRAVKGGTSASKTISILTWFINYNQVKYQRPKISTIVSESFPHLNLGAIRDFKAIMIDRGYWDENLWNDGKHTYTFETGNVLEFMSMDSYGKAHGPRRDLLFLNECNNLSWEIVDQLIIRTREIIWMDWNPSEQFWFHEQIEPFRDDYDYITLNYLDNEALDEITIREIESHKHNLRWWKVYGLGEDGELQHKVYSNWKILEELPHEARLISYGLDYGYTNDPTAIVAVYYLNNAFIFDEIAYTKGLSNKKISEILLSQNPSPVIPDSAEPKSNDELRSYGLTVIPATKGKGSVMQGIQFVQDKACYITSRSVNIIKEYRNYSWKVDDKTGLVINEPQHEFSHAMDAIRYGMQIKDVPSQVDNYVTPVPWQPPGYGKSNIPSQSISQNTPRLLKDRVHLGDKLEEFENYQSPHPWEPAGMGTWWKPEN